MPPPPIPQKLARKRMLFPVARAVITMAIGVVALAGAGLWWLHEQITSDGYPHFKNLRVGMTPDEAVSLMGGEPYRKQPEKDGSTRYLWLITEGTQAEGVVVKDGQVIEVFPDHSKSRSSAQ